MSREQSDVCLHLGNASSGSEVRKVPRDFQSFLGTCLSWLANHVAIHFYFSGIMNRGIESKFL